MFVGWLAFLHEEAHQHCQLVRQNASLFLFTPLYSYEPLHPWKVRVLEDDDSTTRAALTLLKDLFRCNLEPHARQVAYMAGSHWYLRWNTRLASQCTAPAQGLQQGGAQEHGTGAKEAAKEQQGTQGQQGARERVKENSVQKRGKVANVQMKQQTNKQMQHSGTSLYARLQHVASGSQGAQERTRKNEPGSLQKHVQDGGKRVNQEPHSAGRIEATPPSCDDASFVSEVCRRSALHVAKVSHAPPARHRC